MVYISEKVRFAVLMISVLESSMVSVTFQKYLHQNFPSTTIYPECTLKEHTSYRPAPFINTYKPIHHSYVYILHFYTPVTFVHKNSYQHVNKTLHFSAAIINLMVLKLYLIIYY